ncbi:FHA domain-containing protein [Microcoleus sp. FACHB-1515]|nr:FHA domain-containing protein [Microcoleus sp. FACHB-1515]
MPSEYHAHLLIIEDDKGKTEFVLTEPVYRIGRDPDSDIRLVSQFVSKQHATLVWRSNSDGGGNYQIVDGNLNGEASTNGVMINGVKYKRRDLQHEDEIIFGPCVKAVYLVLAREAFPTAPPDLLDNTVKISVDNRNQT